MKHKYYLHFRFSKFRICKCKKKYLWESKIMHKFNNLKIMMMNRLVKIIKIVFEYGNLR